MLVTSPISSAPSTEPANWQTVKSVRRISQTGLATPFANPAGSRLPKEPNPPTTIPGKTVTNKSEEAFAPLTQPATSEQAQIHAAPPSVTIVGKQPDQQDRPSSENATPLLVQTPTQPALRPRSSTDYIRPAVNTTPITGRRSSEFGRPGTTRAPDTLSRTSSELRRPSLFTVRPPTQNKYQAAPLYQSMKRIASQTSLPYADGESWKPLLDVTKIPQPGSRFVAGMILCN